MFSRISEQLIHGVESEEDWIRAWDASSYSRFDSTIHKQCICAHDWISTMEYVGNLFRRVRVIEIML